MNQEIAIATQVRPVPTNAFLKLCFSLKWSTLVAGLMAY